VALFYLAAMFASIDFHSPLFWALMVGWILTVILHEFAHGLVAYLGGDYTIRERGGLSMNPLRYVDPMMSIILPLLFLAWGGVPLPGGATFIRRDLLRHRGWEIAVAAAGPAANFLLFFLLSLALNPKLGWVDYHTPVANWPLEKTFVASLAFFQLLAGLINLIPIPPLDGFQIIGPLLPKNVESTLLQPGIAMAAQIVFFLIVLNSGFIPRLYDVMKPFTRASGVEFYALLTAARLSLYGQT
jgi:Zn-dependent protease